MRGGIRGKCSSPLTIYMHFASFAHSIDLYFFHFFRALTVFIASVMSSSVMPTLFAHSAAASIKVLNSEISGVGIGFKRILSPSLYDVLLLFSSIILA